VVVRAFGCKIGLRASHAELLADPDAYLAPPFQLAAGRTVDRLYSLYLPTSERRGVRPFHLVYVDAALLARAPGRAPLYEALRRDLKLYVAEHAVGRVFVHAGVVAIGGRAVVLPGRSLSGKSTLVEALVRAGATFYSDEYAVLDGHGRVHPFAAPLQRRVSNGAPLLVPPAQLGGAGERPLPVGLVVLTRYRAGARYRPRALSAAGGVLQLLRHTIPARARPEATLTTLRRAVKGAKVVTGARGEADLASIVISQLALH
jgi:hypothetical protein